MSRLKHWIPYLVFAGMAAILYCLPLGIFLISASFRQAWLLYVGNFLFLIPIVLFLVRFNRRRKENAGSLAMLTAGHITTVTGIAIACVLSFILLLIFIPDLLNAGVPEKVLSRSPANMVDDKTNGLTFIVFANAIIGNFATGSFISIIYPFSLKGDQTKEKVPPKQAEL